MNDDQLFLKPNIQVEPLFNQWYAWAHLISPATAARNITERHLPIMDSYISAPEVHASAVKNPKMLGGPFVDHGGKRVDEIEALRAETLGKRARLVKFSEALAELDRSLNDKARGFGLDSLYSSVPEILRGYVELVYDLHNRPAFRLIEPLLYKSDLYDRSAQSLVLSETAGDDRPFVLSTPRLPSDAAIHWELPFDHPLVDDLFELKRTPRSALQIAELARSANCLNDVFTSFFWDQPPKPYQPYQGRGVRWRYFGHACILIEANGVSILSDPVLSYTYESSISRYTYEDLPDHIDFVVITHNHQDHILFETLLQLRPRIGMIVVPRSSGGSLQDPSIRLALKHTGFKNVVELGEMDELPFEGGSLIGLPFLGEHADLDVRSKLAYLVNIGKHRILLAADSRNIDPVMYEHVHALVGDIDAVFLGMECDGAPMTWLYGPLLTRRLDRAMDQSRRLAGSDFEQAVDIVDRFHAKEVYVYAMGQEPWLNHIMSIKYTNESRPIVESNKLIAYCREHGIAAERLFGEKEILLG
jgi:L-ascorbate metabolism protein UlaG (beta-lactamase superfamily)